MPPAPAEAPPPAPPAPAAKPWGLSPYALKSSPRPAAAPAAAFAPAPPAVQAAPPAVVPAAAPAAPVAPARPAPAPAAAPAGPWVPAGADPAAGAEIRRLQDVLRQSTQAPEREEAAARLADQYGRDRGADPCVVQTLLRYAVNDSAPGVRAACVRGLARLNLHNEAVYRTLGQLRSDRDARVRAAAEETLGGLQAARPAR
jgi:hypothetical protein